MHSARETARNVLLLLFFFLYCYRLGAANVEALLNYPFWRDMGPMMSNADFIQLRVDQVWKIFPIMVAPFGLLVVVTAVLALMGASPIPRWAFVGALCFQLVAVISTITIQLPIQFQLSDTGYDNASLERLIATDLWFRKLPSVIEGGFVLAAFWKVIRAARTVPAEAVR